MSESDALKKRGMNPALSGGMNKIIRLNALVLSLTTLMVSTSALPTAQALASEPAVAEQEQQHPLLATADQVRQAQSGKDRGEKMIAQIKSHIRSKKEIISQRKSLISKLDSDQVAENKIAGRDMGAGQAAREAHEVRKRERYQRRQEQATALAQDQQVLARMEYDLSQWENYTKQVTQQRDHQKKQLKAQAEQYRYAAYCQAGMAHAYKPASGFGRFLGGIGKSDAEKNEAEIQAILAGAHCPPAQAVSERRAPRERVIEQVAVPKAIPVAESASAQSAGNFQNPYGN